MFVRCWSSQRRLSVPFQVRGPFLVSSPLSVRVQLSFVKVSCHLVTVLVSYHHSRVVSYHQVIVSWSILVRSLLSCPCRFEFTSVSGQFSSFIAGRFIR
jgi:hypothetical protein